MTERIILYSFYKDLPVCLNHIELLRKFNPGVSIHGIVGGDLLSASEVGMLGLDSVWFNFEPDAVQRRRDGDYAICEWYKDVGYRFSFDMVHCFDWDALLLDSVGDFFKGIRDGVAVCGVLPLEHICDTWYWTSGLKGRPEWLKLLCFVKENYEYKGTPLACTGNGLALSREFIVKYCEVPKMNLCCVEVRIPLLAQCFGIPVYDNKMSSEFFKVTNEALSEEQVLKAYTSGVKAFHPVRCIVNLK